ncbi:MAG: 6-phosphogluconolactonase, partial [Candidatus Gracilibacteria bacterium]|nr:6-phosphogluconolactonase [Candidatus Gracilibacteria bacterium]
MTYDSERVFYESVASSVRARLLKANREGKVFRMALSGGSTPGPLYDRLSSMSDIDWSRIELYEVDERMVPKTDKQSNKRLIEETFIKKLSAQPKKWQYFDTGLDRNEALDVYERGLDKTDPTFFDLVLLGLGMDGHTASLFPDSPPLQESKRWVAHTTTEEFDVKDRLTLTYPALESSEEIFFIVKG